MNLFCLAKNEDQAHRIVTHLQDEGFDAECISFLVYDREKRLTRTTASGEVETNPKYFSQSTRRQGAIGHEKHTKAPEGAATGATAGGIIGGTLGLLAGLGALAIPGLGAFIAAGPIMAALSGSAVGGSLGLILGALVGLGLPEYEAKKLEKGLKEGSILISVDADDSEELERAQRIMKAEHATDISCVREKAGSR